MFYVSQVWLNYAVASAHCVCIIDELLTVSMQLLASGPAADVFWLADGRIAVWRQHTVFALQLTWSLCTCSCWHLAPQQMYSG